MLGLIAGSTFNSLEQNTIQAVSGSNFNSIRAAGGFWETLFPSTGFSVVMQFIIVVGILWYGLEQAKASGTYGGKLVVGWAETTRKWAEGKAKAVGKYGTDKLRTSTSGLAQKALMKDDKGERTKLRDSVVGALQTPIVGGILGKALKGPLALAEQRKKLVDEVEKKLEPQSNQMLELQWQSADLNKKAAIANIFNKRNYLSRTKDFIKNDLEEVMKLTVSLGTGKDLMLAAPDIAIKNNVIGGDRIQTLAKINELFEKLKPEEVKKLQDETFDKIAVELGGTASAEYQSLMSGVISKWSGRHISNTNQEPPQPKNQKAIEDYLRSLNPVGTSRADRILTIKAINDKLANYLESGLGANEIIDLN